jgi:hypothetical protein
MAIASEAATAVEPIADEDRFAAIVGSCDASRSEGGVNMLSYDVEKLSVWHLLRRASRCELVGSIIFHRLVTAAMFGSSD